MTLTQLCEAAAVVYGYDDVDKKCINELAKANCVGLREALEHDPLVLHYLRTGINPMERA